MNQVVESYYKHHLDKWGKPQRYKTIDLYPIKIIDEDMYFSMNDLLGLCKNLIPDKEIIKMRYLRFLICIVSDARQRSLSKDLEKFLSYITKKEVQIQMDYISYPNEFSLYVVIDGVSYTEEDFDNIREIILQQNGTSIEYVEQFNPELEDSLRFVNRNLNHTIEDELFALATGLGVTINELENYTYYQFKKHFERLGLFIDYNTLKPLEASGQITFKEKNGINHWLHHIPNRGRYDSILIQKATFVETSDVFKVASNK